MPAGPPDGSLPKSHLTPTRNAAIRPLPLSTSSPPTSAPRAASPPAPHPGSSARPSLAAWARPPTGGPQHRSAPRRSRRCGRARGWARGLELTELGPALVTTPAQTLRDLSMQPAHGSIPGEAAEAGWNLRARGKTIDLRHVIEHSGRASAGAPTMLGPLDGEERDSAAE